MLLSLGAVDVHSIREAGRRGPSPADQPGNGPLARPASDVGSLAGLGSRDCARQH